MFLEFITRDTGFVSILDALANYGYQDVMTLSLNDLKPHHFVPYALCRVKPGNSY